MLALWLTLPNGHVTMRIVGDPVGNLHEIGLQIDVADGRARWRTISGRGRFWSGNSSRRPLGPQWGNPCLEPVACSKRR